MWGSFGLSVRAALPCSLTISPLQFVRDVGDGILPSWQPIVQRQRQQPFSEAQRQWQLLRRGRYLEFNLLYDRGVKFGLDGGRCVTVVSVMLGLECCVGCVLLWVQKTKRLEKIGDARLVAQISCLAMLNLGTTPLLAPLFHTHIHPHPTSISRIEAIMVSAPPLIAWRYNVQPEAGSEEERLVQVLSQPRDWA